VQLLQLGHDRLGLALLVDAGRFDFAGQALVGQLDATQRTGSSRKRTDRRRSATLSPCSRIASRLLGATYSATQPRGPEVWDHVPPHSLERARILVER
jgi:hypothetical protein